MVESTVKPGENVWVNFGSRDNRQGVVLEGFSADDNYRVQLHDGRIVECVIGRDGKLHPFQPKQKPTFRRPSLHTGNDVIDLIIGVCCLMLWVGIIAWAIVAGFFRLTSKTISRRTVDRFLLCTACWL